MNTTTLVLMVLVLSGLGGLPAFAEYTCNCGPNTQTTGAPANPLVQSIHPR